MTPAEKFEAAVRVAKQDEPVGIPEGLSREDAFAIIERVRADRIIEHPPHYTSHPSGVECITVTEHMGFNLGNAIKYIWRADEKGSRIDDLKKARWYVDREIQRLTSL